MKNIFILSSAYCIFILSACSGLDGEKREIDFKQFESYWYQGKAEISSFDLIQYRYGEPRQGEAVLIFVTEDHSRKKHVKLDDPKSAGRDAEKVLKLNKTKSFDTGIYTYHMMLSVFSPVYIDAPALKLTHSSQEWCGQSFTQLNLNGRSYDGRLYSYFEEEGDRSFTVEGIAEDHLWNLIRLNPRKLPLGEQYVFPGLMEQRFSHQPLEGFKANIYLNKLNEELDELEVDYEDYNRNLKIRFERKFPYYIVSFVETNKNEDGALERTEGIRKAVIQTDYWEKNRNQDSYLREELKLVK